MVAAGAALAALAQAPRAAAPVAMRLYVFDYGLLNITRDGVERYHVTTTEVGETRMPVPCFMVAHPRGTLMWDVGVVPDDDVENSAGGGRSAVNATAAALVTRTLRSQLAAIGYQPSDITYVAVSHAHKDHTANLNQFARATWLTTQAERDFMWKPNNERVDPRFYSALEHSRWTRIDRDEYDVFGDGKVIIKAAPGHTPGHQVLVLTLGVAGRVMIAGDLYHYPAERTFQRAPPDNEFDVRQSAASRRRIEDYLRKTKTAIWIEHEWAANARLKKSPEYYE
jgi:glyoxylase-like metal-dependent hydrolase (beta-lactamase superfamily II)